MRTGLFTFLMAFFSIVSVAQTFDKFVVFGDSLSDNGGHEGAKNWTKVLHEKSPSIPVAPKPEVYLAGRFSNGPVWIERLAEKLGLPPSDPRYFEDYAFGGAWADTKSNILFPPPLDVQVTHYLIQDISDQQRGAHAYVLLIAANDYLTHFNAGKKAIKNTVDSIQYQIERLIYHGGRYFIVPNLPNLGDTPKAKRIEAEKNLSDISIEHNKSLNQMLDKLEKTYPTITVVRFNIYDALKGIFDGASLDNQYGFYHFKEPCYTGPYYDPTPAGLPPSAYTICPDDAHYVFWDEVHPTTRVHEIFSEKLFELLTEKGLA